MNLPFQDIDPEDQNFPEQKLSFVERSLIGLGINLAKVVLWKIGKAKTYGDLYKIINFFEDQSKDIEKEFEEANEDTVVNKVMSTVKSLHKGVQEL